MPAGVGIDLIEIERVERALERRPRLAQRLFTHAEIAYAEERARPARHLAARFAAKEAVIKALGTGVPPSQIEIEAGAPPRVRLSGAAAQVARERGAELSVSLTHSREAAAAVAIALPAA
jgi:holo-[acyl-carrier protein] synthase